MPTNKQRREAARRHLERQLERRQEREAARKRFTLIASIVGTLVLIAVIVIFIVAVSGDDKKTKTAASTTPTTSGSPTPTPTPSTSYPAAKGKSVSFDGVTVTGAADLAGKPTVTSKSTTDPAKLEYKDLVVGTGTTPTATSTVSIQYVGVLYKNGTKFDSSWDRGSTTDFPLNQVIPGFTQGIGGTTGVPPMKVGGRRLIIIPSALAYGTAGQGSIPANAPLVFVVDLKSVTAAS